MKVAITGGEGQVGRALRASVPDGMPIIALARADLDIADADAVAAVLDHHAPQYLFNAAAYTAVDRAEDEPEAAARINANGPAVLARACADRGIGLCHFSTDFVFDGAASLPYRPSDMPAPLSVYGRTKQEGEIAVLAHPGHLVVRTAWVYAAGGANFVATMLRLMKERDEIRVVSDQIGTPTHAASLAQAAWKLCETGAEGIHHFTDAGLASWYDFAVAIKEEALDAGLLTRDVTIVPIMTNDYPAAARRPAYGVLDKSGTWALLGGPARHWRTELRDMLAMQRGMTA